MPSKFLKIMNLFRPLVDFFYPPFCTICQSALQRDEIVVCEQCWSEIPRVDEHADIVAEISAGLSSPVFFTQAYSIWQFDGPIQQIIHLLKYQNYRILARKMGEFMADKIRTLSIPDQDIVLIPVPLHKTRVRERGYNQSFLLCESIASRLTIPFSDKILVRRRYTQSQTRLNATNRQKNVRDAFQVVAPELINGKTVILVDDVITTGATMNACASTLAKSGVSEICLVSAAKA
ncbi:MAG: ComF family protein [Candidatus Zhuqueibacterota bacterium]